jgi:hypothetical protein
VSGADILSPDPRPAAFQDAGLTPRTSGRIGHDRPARRVERPPPPVAAGGDGRTRGDGRPPWQGHVPRGRASLLQGSALPRGLRVTGADHGVSVQQLSIDSYA